MFTFYEQDIIDGVWIVKKLEFEHFIDIVSRISNEHYADGLTAFIVVPPGSDAGVHLAAQQFIEFTNSLI